MLVQVNAHQRRDPGTDSLRRQQKFQNGQTRAGVLKGDALSLCTGCVLVQSDSVGMSAARFAQAAERFGADCIIPGQMEDHQGRMGNERGGRSMDCFLQLHAGDNAANGFNEFQRTFSGRGKGGTLTDHHPCAFCGERILQGQSPVAGCGNIGFHGVRLGAEIAEEGGAGIRVSADGGSDEQETADGCDYAHGFRTGLFIRNAQRNDGIRFSGNGGGKPLGHGKDGRSLLRFDPFHSGQRVGACAALGDGNDECLPVHFLYAHISRLGGDAFHREARQFAEGMLSETGTVEGTADAQKEDFLDLQSFEGFADALQERFALIRGPAQGVGLHGIVHLHQVFVGAHRGSLLFMN